MGKRLHCGGLRTTFGREVMLNGTRNVHLNYGADAQSWA